MRIAIFGASGRIGGKLIQQALEQGHPVQALVRPQSISKIAVHPNLSLIAGSVENREDVLRATASCDVVVSCLGMNRKSASPWAQHTSPKTLLSTAAQNIVAALEAHSIKRLMYVSVAGAGNSWLKTSWLMRLVVKSSRIEDEVKDHTQAEAILRASALDWTIVRPVPLTDVPSIVELVPIEGRISPFLKVSRSSVAHWILGHLEDSLTQCSALTLGIPA